MRIPMPSGAMDMPGMRMAMGPHPWSMTDAWLVFAMWAVMMVAMMIPSASPMIEMYARIARGNEADVDAAVKAARKAQPVENETGRTQKTGSRGKP